MDEKLQDVRRDIELTRTALEDKITRLENRIAITKNTTLNPAYHVQTRPWPTLAGVVAVGWIVGRAIRSKLANSRSRQEGDKERVLLVPDSGRSRKSLASNLVGMLAATLLREFIASARRRRH